MSDDKTGNSNNKHGSTYSDPVFGTIGGHETTAAFGQGSRNGETLLSDGNRTGSDTPNFYDHGNHNHYGSGNGPNNNVKDRGQYKGPGC
jgi:hypothetical protein